MSTITDSETEQMLETLDQSLRWYASYWRHPERRGYGWTGFRYISSLTDRLIRVVQPEHKVVLTLGTNAVQTIAFVSESAGAYLSETRMVAGGSKIILHRTIMDETKARLAVPEQYLGGIEAVALKDMAFTLADGGSLEVVHFDQAVEEIRPAVLALSA